MKIAVSACLLGENCKYNGGNNLNKAVLAFVKGHKVVPICPEVLGGLPTPRLPAEIVDNIVINKEGINVDSYFRQGAELALHKVLNEGVTLCVLQPRSPSCGSKEVYDGSFSGKKIPGTGIFASMLIKNGIKVIDAEDLE